MDSVGDYSVVYHALQFAYRDETSPEKVHPHLNKPYYAQGDTIWFKAYVVSGPQSKAQISRRKVGYLPVTLYGLARSVTLVSLDTKVTDYAY